MAIIIKGRLIDAKNPTICVPIVDTTTAGILRHASNLVEKNIEMIEWRADCYEYLDDSKKVREVLEKLRDITSNTILLVTVRTRAQGGLCAMPEEELRGILIEIAQAHAADLIDVEYFSFENPGKIVTRLQERGALVVLSHHDFVETPKRAVMRTLLSGMSDIDPDIVKLATTPLSMQDVSNLLSVTDEFVTDNPGTPVITMSMGRQGAISRIGGFCFGSCVTFASDGEASAPGQLPYEDVATAIRLLIK